MPEAVRSGEEMRWEHSVVDLRTFTLLWNKAMSDFSLLSQSSVPSCVLQLCHGMVEPRARL